MSKIWFSLTEFECSVEKLKHKLSELIMFVNSHRDASLFNVLQLKTQKKTACD